MLKEQIDMENNIELVETWIFLIFNIFNKIIISHKNYKI